MSALAVTANNVAPSGSFGKVNCELGATVTAGQVIYQKSSDSKWYLAQCDGTAEESGYGVQMAIALANGVANQWIVGLTSGTYTSGATHTKGYEVLVHTTAGSFTETIGDVAVSTQYRTRIGYSTSTTQVAVDFLATGLVY